MTITGIGFEDNLPLKCHFGLSLAASIERTSSQEMVCVTGSNMPAGSVDAGVSVDDTHLALAPYLFVVFSTPNVTAVFPRSGPATGNTSVTLFGTDFPVSTTISCWFDFVTSKGNQHFFFSLFFYFLF